MNRTIEQQVPKLINDFEQEITILPDHMQQEVDKIINKTIDDIHNINDQAEKKKILQEINRIQNIIKSEIQQQGSIIKQENETKWEYSMNIIEQTRKNARNDINSKITNADQEIKTILCCFCNFFF